MPIKAKDLIPVEDFKFDEIVIFMTVMKSVPDEELNEFYMTLKYFIQKDDYAMAQAYAIGKGEYRTADIIDEIVKKGYNKP